MHKLNTINSEMKQLKVTFRRNDKSNTYELNNIIGNAKDARAFIFLLDRFNTDKELTRETIEDLIDLTVNFNELIVQHLEEKKQDLFTIKNAKLMVAGAIFIGVVISISNSERLAEAALNYVGVEVKQK